MAQRSSRVDGDYDESVHFAAAQAEANGWLIVSDTSYPGYMDCPRYIKAGYTMIGQEILDALGDGPLPTHILLQTGCGGLAGGIAGGLWAALGDNFRASLLLNQTVRRACCKAPGWAQPPHIKLPTRA